MLTQTNEIQSLLEDLTKREEERGEQLKKRMEELSAQLSQKNVSAQVLTEVKFGDTVRLRIGTGKFEKVIRANATFDDFLKFVQVTLGTDKANVGYKDDQGKTVWVRTNQDIHFMFTWYFSQELPNIPVVSIPMDEIRGIEKFNLRKESIHKDGMAIFKCEVAGSEGPLIFLVIPNNLNMEDGMAYLQNIFGPLGSLMFVDEAEDIITIDSMESWEYCIETGIAMSKTGRFPLLLIQAGQ